MFKSSQVALFVLNGLLLTTAVPQYGSPGGGGDVSVASGGPGPAAASAFSSGPAPAAASGFSGGPAPASSSSSGGSGGGDLTVQCKAAPDSAGKIKYDCSGVNKDAITLKTEHFLWLDTPGGLSQNLDIEIPNYNIDEFIKAAYKALGPQEGAKINILLKKPDLTYNAEKADAPKSSVGAPAVSVNYQPVQKVSVHYPSQKPYSNGGGSSSSGGSASGSSGGPGPSGGPASSGGPGPSGGPAPSGGPGASGGGSGGGAYSRPQRESGFRYYFIRQ